MTPAEIEAAIEAFNLLEPEVQKGVAALIHLLQKPSDRAGLHRPSAYAAGQRAGGLPPAPPSAMSA